MGVSVLDSLLDLLRSEGILRIPPGVTCIRSRLWNGSYRDPEIVKYSLAIDLMKGAPFKFDGYLRKFMKYLVYNPNNLEAMDNATQALKSLHQYLLDNQKRDIIPKNPSPTENTGGKEKNLFVIQSNNRALKNGKPVYQSSSTLALKEGREKESTSPKEQKKRRENKSIISKNMNMNLYKLPPLSSANVAVVSKIDMSQLMDHLAQKKAGQNKQPPGPIKQPPPQGKTFKNKSRILKSQK